MAQAQLSGYYEQGFESTTFPPTGWISQSIAGAGQWARSTTEARDGVASAYMVYQSTIGQDWLVTPQFTAVAGDSLTFWMKLDFQGYQPDSLVIRVSNTTNTIPTAFTTRILGLSEGTNYPPDDDNWYRYAVSLNAFAGQNIYIAFSHYNADGDGLYIDKVAIGTLPPNDVAVTTFNDVLYAQTQSSNTYDVTVVNQGSAVQTFNTTMEINPGGYTSTQTVTALNPGSSANITFAPWTPATSGSYTMKVYTQLTGDANKSNDTLVQTLNVYDPFPNYGWESSTPIPAARWSGGQAFTQICNAGTDTAYLYYLAGYDGAFANTAICYKQNLVTGAWQTIANIPVTRGQVSAAAIGSNIYVPGGYTGSFSPTNQLHIYNTIANSWSTGATLPTATGDYGIGTYADSLIYLVGGYNGITDINTVQIYNANTNTWTTGTVKPGTATSGGRMGIAGNRILYVGGYNQALGTIDDAWLGTIDPANPTTITWTAAADFPAGPRGRFTGGNSIGNDGRIYFSAGDPDGDGTFVQAETFAYNTVTGTWEIGPLKPSAVSNVSNLTSVVRNDSIYMVSVGGYDGIGILSVNEWLNIGPYTGAPYAGIDQSTCGPDTVNLIAYNGLSYAWNTAGTISDPSVASPNVYLTGTDTITVTMAARLGCPVTDTIIVTVNPIPSISFASTSPLCFGSSDGSIQSTVTNGLGVYDYLWNNGDTDALADNIPAGSYSLTVTDSTSGCTRTDSTMLTEPALLQVALSSSVTDLLCFGDQNGSFDLTVTGGTTAYTYLWNDNDTTEDRTALGAGIYSLTVTDANGCADSSFTDTVTTPSAIAVSGVTTDALCFGDQNGTIDLTVSGGTPVYTFLWNDSDVNEDRTGLAAGMYSVSVTDANGCIDSSFTGTIGEPAELTASCPDDTTMGCTGELTVTVLGGTPGYTYSWTGVSATTPTVTGLCDGTYTCTITDDNGCTTSVTAEVINTGAGLPGENDITVSVYPNPFTGQIVISGLENGMKAEIMIYSMEGRQLFGAYIASANEMLPVDLSSAGLAPGMYNLVLILDGKTIIRKPVIKQ